MNMMTTISRRAGPEMNRTTVENVMAAGFALNIVALFDFQAAGENGPEQIMALRVVFVFLPIVFYASALAVMWNYPISEARHRRLMGLLERRVERRARAAAAQQGDAA